jgi:hypothetical protein
MIIAPLHSRLLSIASSFKLQQLEKLKQVADAATIRHPPSSLPVSTSALSEPVPLLPTAKSHQQGLKKGKLRRPFNQALNKCAPFRLLSCSLPSLSTCGLTSCFTALLFTLAVMQVFTSKRLAFRDCSRSF